MQSYQDKLRISIMKKYNALGMVAFYHPRSKTISLNGGIEKPVIEQIGEMMRGIKAREEEWKLLEEEGHIIVE